MNLTKREKTLLLIVPAFVIFAAYFTISGKAVWDKLSTLETQLQQAKAQAVDPIRVRSEKAKLKEMSNRILAKSKEREDLVEKAKVICGQSIADRGDFESIDALTRILEQHGLRLLVEEPAANQLVDSMAGTLENETSQLRKSIEQLRQEKESRTDVHATISVSRQSALARNTGRYRRLRFQGTFLNVLGALDELSNDYDGAIPVSISMEEIGMESYYGQSPSWTLVVRI